jgi:hypothetical protein
MHRLIDELFFAVTGGLKRKNVVLIRCYTFSLHWESSIFQLPDS